MHTPAEFRDVVRRGLRMGRPTLIVHAGRSLGDDVRVGFVVSKTVGNAVTRNLVKRRLRHLTVAVLARTPPGTRVVVRALPRAATHPNEVSRDLDQAWAKAMQRLIERRLPRARS